MADYKKIRRLCINPSEDNEPKMHTLFECLGKVGTTSTTRLWFMEEPQKGKWIYGIGENSHYTPYMNGHAFRYASFDMLVADDVYTDGYIICHKP